MPLQPERVFPDKTLLNHVPLLLRRLAEAVVEGTEILESDFVRSELDDIGRLRRSQGYSPAEVGGEFLLLADVVFEHIEAECPQLPHADTATTVRIARDLQAALGTMARHVQRRMRLDQTSEQVARDQLLDDFGRSVTHELRNRLNACRLALELLRTGDGSADAEMMDRLGRSLQRVNGVVGDVLAVAVARRSVDPEGVDRARVGEVVNEVVHDLAEHAEEHGVSLRAEPELPSFWVDGGRLRIALLNLVGNGIKYADPDKSDPWVTVGARRLEDRSWEIVVRDNGRGIPEHELPHIFQQGVRGSDTDDQPGEGLGLALAARAAERLGGELTATSEVGIGSTFRFEITEPQKQLDDSE